MSNKTDPALYASEFERNEGDRYWTGPSEAAAIARRVPDYVKTVWEPCAGRGDLARVIKDYGFDVFASDIDPSEFDTTIGPVEKTDFLGDTVPGFFIDEKIDAIITNPPFGKEAEACVRKALSYDNIDYVAFFLRSEWKHGSRRFDLFNDPKYNFSKEIVLTWRPRWDWWFRDKPEASPRHNFSWLVWDRRNPRQHSEWATRSK
jgi:hypothetical protein